MFAALTTVQAPIVEREGAILTERDKPWHEQRLPMLDGRVRDRLDQLSNRLGDADWLEGAFSAADLLLANVLRRLKTSNLLDDYPNLAAYVARAEARPAFQRAFAAQLAVFTGSAGKRADRNSGRPSALDTYPLKVPADFWRGRACLLLAAEGMSARAALAQAGSRWPHPD